MVNKSLTHGENEVTEKRGRKSLGDLAVVAMDPLTGRPLPPADVTGREAEVWESTVESMPRNWFGKETWPLLRGFCKHSYAAERLGERYSELLAEGPPPAGERVLMYWAAIDKISSLYDRETRSITSLSTKLRISKQARVERAVQEAALRNMPKRKMWEE